MENYRLYTKPAELHKAINTLRGMISGINADRKIGEAEMLEISNWITLQQDFIDRHPFSELIPKVQNALADGVITEEEREDILWLCSSFVAEGKYYDVITSGAQFLSGLVYGMMADDDLSDSEIRMLKTWLENNEYLVGIYPYDELNTIVTTILADNSISEDERNILKAFIGNLIDFSSSANLSEREFSDLRKQYSVDGICEMCPEIEFDGRCFCFTGASSKPRAELEAIVYELGGECRGTPSKKTDYLVVGREGNPCWAFSCYGRKIETAIQLRKQGYKIKIIDENDFFDAVCNARS